MTEQVALVGPAATDNIGPFRRWNTPSVAGYAVAAFTALGIGSVLVPVALGGGGGPTDFVKLVGLVLAVGFLVVLMVGLPLTLMAHVAVRRVRSQSIHVAAFGVVGLVTGYLVRLGIGFPYGLPLPAVAAVGVSAAAGRAVVNRRPR